MATVTTTVPQPNLFTRQPAFAVKDTAARPPVGKPRHLGLLVAAIAAAGLALFLMPAVPGLVAAGAELAGRGIAIVGGWAALCNHELAAIASYTAPTALGR